MSEIQEKMWLVMSIPTNARKVRVPVKVFDDREDARNLASRLNKRSRQLYFRYTVQGVKKG